MQIIAAWFVFSPRRLTVSKSQPKILRPIITIFSSASDLALLDSCIQPVFQLCIIICGRDIGYERPDKIAQRIETNILPGAQVAA